VKQMLGLSLLMAASPAMALGETVLAPATQFTARKPTSGPGESVDSDDEGIFGFVQLSPFLVDETFFEFDLSSVPTGQSAVLEFLMLSLISPEPVARTFDVSTYSGSGVPDAVRHGQGTFFQTLLFEAPTPPYADQLKLYSLDVTALASAAAGGAATLGFRLHNPVDLTAGSDHVPFVEYIIDTAKLTLVPEPSTAWGLVVVAAALAGTRRERSRSRRG
jgi:hypothetical protein